MKEDWYPTSIDIGTNSKKTQSDVFTVGFDDGVFHIKTNVYTI